MSDDKKQKLLDKMPPKGKAWLLVRHSNIKELNQLLNEYIQRDRRQDYEALVKAIRKNRKPVIIPKWA